MNRIYTYVSVLSTRKSVQPLKKQTFAIDSVFRLTDWLLCTIFVLGEENGYSLTTHETPRRDHAKEA
jgi:hypothetical protein